MLRSTYIFIVPFGPKFVRKTSCRPLAALMLMASACVDLATSALGFKDFIAAMVNIYVVQLSN